VVTLVVLFIKTDEMDGGRESLHVNMPEWLSRHGGNPKRNDLPFSTSPRRWSSDRITDFAISIRRQGQTAGGRL
jgi:hypothetical protein